MPIAILLWDIRARAQCSVQRFLNVRQYCENSYGCNDGRTATATLGLAELYTEQEKYQDAVHLFLGLLDIGEGRSTNDLKNVALNWLGIVYIREGRFKEAIKEYNTLLEVGVDNLELEIVVLINLSAWKIIRKREH